MKMKKIRDFPTKSPKKIVNRGQIITVAHLFLRMILKLMTNFNNIMNRWEVIFKKIIFLISIFFKILTVCFMIEQWKVQKNLRKLKTFIQPSQ